MNHTLNQILLRLKQNLALYFSISLGIFLFVLFFEPFSLDKFDFNNHLIFIAGLGAITFLLMAIIQLGFSSLVSKYDHTKEEPLFLSFLAGFLMLALSSVAFAFYLRYVGSVHINFPVMFKIIFICLAPPVILRIYFHIVELKQQNLSLVKDLKKNRFDIKKEEEEYLNTSIELTAENNADSLKLKIMDISLIRSANNYVEIIYREENVFKKHLLRNTLKNIEQQLGSFNVFIRCHRTCIINRLHLEKLNTKMGNHWLTIKNYKEQISVSRQYLLKLREII